MAIGGCILARMPSGSSWLPLPRLPPQPWPRPSRRARSGVFRGWPAHAHGHSCEVAWQTGHFSHLGGPAAASMDRDPRRVSAVLVRRTARVFIPWSVSFRPPLG